MQKVYLLLRNNQQTGPFSLEELAQQQLKNTDLIWIEGSGAGWYYPNEVDALKPYLQKAPPPTPTPAVQQPAINQTANKTEPPTPPVSPKKVFVSMPANSKATAPVQKATPAPEPAPVQKQAAPKTVGDYFEQRAEQMRKKVQQFPAQKEAQQIAASGTVNESRPIPTPLSKEEEKPAEVKTKATVVAEQKPVETQPLMPFELDEVPTFAIHNNAKKEEAKSIEKEPSFVPVLPKKIKEEPVPVEEEEIPVIAPRQKIAKQIPAKKSNHEMQYLAAFLLLVAIIGGGWFLYKSFSSKGTKIETAQAAKPLQAGETSTSVAGATNEATDTPLISENVPTTDFNVPVETATLPQVTPADPNAIKAKPKKTTEVKKTETYITTVPVTQQQQVQEVKQEPVVVERKEVPVQETRTETVANKESEEKKGGFFNKIGGLFKKKKTDDPNTDERSTTAPDGERAAAKRNDVPVATNLTNQVDITINTSDNKWMIGVQGLKLTLHNRSEQKLKKATVEVIYFNEDGGVIDRKTISFSGIAPKKSQTVAAPDHQLADHAGYKVVTAVGEN